MKNSSFGMLRRVALVRTDVSLKRSAFIIRMTIIGELGTTLAVTSNRRTLRRNTKSDRKLVWNTRLRMWRVVGVAGRPPFHRSCGPRFVVWPFTIPHHYLSLPFSSFLFLSHVIFLRSVRRLPVTANVFPSSPILVTLMMQTLISSPTSVLTRVTRRNIP
jgi:hypothetical protein